jgi:hypothetical protein
MIAAVIAGPTKPKAPVPLKRPEVDPPEVDPPELDPPRGRPMVDPESGPDVGGDASESWLGPGDLAAVGVEVGNALDVACRSFDA